MRGAKVLIVDDDPRFCNLISIFLSMNGCEVTISNNPEDAIQNLEKDDYDIVILDLKLPRRSGVNVLKEIKERWEGINVIVVSAFGTIEDAVSAMKLGALDFIQKPLNRERLLEIVKSAMEKKGSTFQEECFSSGLDFELVGNSNPMRQLKLTIQKVARAKGPVLITGETGSGKELVARMVHLLSKRANFPFVVVNCAAIPATLLESEFFGYVRGAFTGANETRSGFFEEANRGTIFLDEIAEFDLALQAKLLRVLENEEIFRVGSTKPIKVDVRVISATNSNLKELIATKRFREDLYYRLNVFPIHVPALREHIEDLPLLISHILKKFQKTTGHKTKGADPEFIQLLSEYSFPGNVRELENIIERAISFSTGSVLTRDSVPLEIVEAIEMQKSIEELKTQDLTLKKARNFAFERIEKILIQQALEETNRNFSEASLRLGISRSALYYKAKKYKV